MAFDTSKGSVIFEFNFAAAKTPTVADVKRHFKLADNEIDEAFGVIPLGKTFLAVISSAAAARVEKQHPAGFVQNWSNGPVGPF